MILKLWTIKLRFIGKKINTNRKKKSDSVLGMYCTSCEIPLCFKCTGHENHTLVDIRKAYETKRQQYEGIIDNIRSEVLYSRSFLLSVIKDDVKECHTKFYVYQPEMLKKVQRVKEYMLSSFDFKHRCLGQIRKIISHLTNIQAYEYNVEQSSSVKFLSSVNKLHHLNKQSSPHLTYHSQLSITRFLINKDVIDFLSLVYTAERGIRKVKNESLLKLMHEDPELHETLTVTCVLNCRHISFVTSDQFWISDRKCNLRLTNKKGDILCKLTDACSGVVVLDSTQ